MIIIVIFAVLLIFLLEEIPLIKKRMWKELTTAGLILLIAIFLQIGKDLGLITPINLMRKLFEPIGKIFFTQL